MSWKTVLEDAPCEVSVTELRLQVAVKGAYLYPDIMVICQREPSDPADMVSNPTVIVEVLSPSTERWDRGRKFAEYRQVASLREYVLISQDEMRVEWYTRRENKDWVYQETTSTDGVCRLESLDVTLALGRIYKKWLPPK